MQSDSQKGFVLSVLSGAFVATITALISILIFASIIKVFTLDNSVVKTVSQFLKVLAIFLGCMFSLRDNKGLIKGATVGVVFTAVIYLLFKLVDGTIVFGSSFIVDLLFGLIVGAISGIISVNLKGN